MSKQHMNTLSQNFPFASINVSDIFFSTLLVSTVHNLKRFFISPALCLCLCWLKSLCQITDKCFLLLVWLALFLLHDDMKDGFPFLFILLLLLLELSHHHLLRDKDEGFSSASPYEVSLSSFPPLPSLGGQSQLNL